MEVREIDTEIAELHIIMPVESPEQCVKQLVRESTGQVHVLDLSMGNFNVPSMLCEHVHSICGKSDCEVIWIDGHDFAPLVGDKSRLEYVNWLCERADTKGEDGRSIKEWFTYQNEASLWWFSALSVKDVFNRVYPRWQFFAIHVLKYLASEGVTTESTSVWSVDEEVGRSIKIAAEYTISSATRIRHVSSCNAEQGPPLLKRIVDSIRSLEVTQIVRSIFSNVRRIVEEVNFSRRKIEPLQSETFRESATERRPLAVVFTRFPHAWQIERKIEESDKGEFLDHYLADAPRRLREHGVNVAWLPDVESDEKNLNEWMERRGKRALPDVLPWMVLKWTDALRVIGHLMRWKVLYVWLFLIRRIHDRWHYEGIPLGDWLKRDYRYLCLGAGGFHMLEVERLRRAFQTIKPDAVVYRNEFHFIGRRIATAAIDSMELIGVQHGMLQREDTTYQLHPSEIGTERKTNKTREQKHLLPVPDRCAVFGTYNVNYFEKWSSYPIDRIHAIGGVRHDRLAENYLLSGGLRSERVGRIRKKLNLPLNQPVILICTDFERSARTLLTLTIKGMQMAGISAFLAIKPHHYHSSKSTVKETLDEERFKNYSIYGGSIYQLMFVADVIVTGTSTVTIESCLLDTPSIVAAAHQEYQLYPYIEENIGRVVTNAGSMGECLRYALTNGTLVKRNNKVLKRHLDNADAKACVRLAKLILKTAGT